MIDNALIRNVFAQIAGAYLVRELDRRWIDDLLANTQIGARLRKLTPPQIRGLELVMYTLAAYASQSAKNPSELRIVLEMVLTDLPIEIIKRLMDAQSGTPKDILATLNSMSDEELLALYREISRRMHMPAGDNGALHLVRLGESMSHDGDDRQSSVPRSSGSPPASQATAIREAADGIAAWRKNLRDRYAH